MAPIERTAALSGVNGADRAKAMRPALLRLGVMTLATIGALVSLSAPAAAQNAFCDNLRAQIAAAGSDPAAARYRAAAAKQQKEIARTAAYGRSIGCDRQQFLFFGNPPPPQCATVNARLAQMQANLAALERGAGGERRQALIARYDAQCRQRVAARPKNFFEELFGIQEDEDPTPPRDVPVGPRPEDEGGGRGLGGSMAVCVRSCDGGFFPISYSARRANLEELAELCRAQCPGAEVKLYTRSPWRDIDTALSIDGQPYRDHPNAMKFAKSFDPACSCKPPGKSWAETLAEAERILAERHRGDEVVSEEKAEELSRPVAARAPRKSAPPPQEPAPDAAPPPAPTGAAENRQETTREVVGPDGVKRRVRVVAPTL
jgi:hypothetical protein